MILQSGKIALRHVNSTVHLSEMLTQMPRNNNLDVNSIKVEYHRTAQFTVNDLILVVQVGGIWERSPLIFSPVKPSGM